jgi:hypothetical protein
MHDPVYVLPGIPLPRTSVNKGKKKAGSIIAPALLKPPRFRALLSSAIAPGTPLRAYREWALL